MDEDDAEYYEDDEQPEPVVLPAYRPGKWRWINPLILGVQVVEETGQAVVDGLGNLKMLLVQHANHAANTDKFVAEAGRELETILSSNDDIS